MAVVVVMVVVMAVAMVMVMAIPTMAMARVGDTVAIRVTGALRTDTAAIQLHPQLLQHRQHRVSDL